MPTKVHIKTKQQLTAVQAAELFSSIALDLANGNIQLKGNGHSGLLHPGPVISLELEGKEDLRRGEVSIKIAWESDLRVAGGSRTV